MSAAPKPNKFAGFFKNVEDAAGNFAKNAYQDVTNGGHLGVNQNVTNALPQPIKQKVQQINTNLDQSPLGAIASGQFDKFFPRVQQSAQQANQQLQTPQGLMAATMGSVGPMEMGAAGDLEGAASSYPYAKSANVSADDIARNKEVRQIRYKGKANAPAMEDTAHSTLDRMGLTGAAEDQLRKFPEVKSNIYNWIKNESSMATKPVDIAVSDVRDEIEKAVKDEFGSAAPKGSSLNDVVSQHMSDVYDKAREEQQQLAAQPKTQQNATTPYFDSQTDMSPSTTKGESAGQRMVRDMRFKQGNPAFKKNIPAIAGAEPSFALDTNGTTPMSGGSAGMSPVEPAKINSQSIYNMKVAANNTPEVGSAFDKIRDGRKDQLNDAEKIALAARDAYDSIISKLHPDVKTATKDLSTLHDPFVYGGLETARTKPPEALPGKIQKFANFFKNPSIAIPAGVLGVTNIGNIPKILGGAANLAGGGLAVAENALNSVGNKPKTDESENPFASDSKQPNSGEQENINHGQSISENGPDVNGHYSISPQTQPSFNFMTYQDWQAKRSALDPYDPAYSQKVGQLDSQYQAGQSMAKNSLSGEKSTFMNPGGAKYFLDLGNEVHDEFAKMPPSFLNGLKGYSDIKAYLDANPKTPYQKQLSNIDRLNTQYTAAVRMITGEKLNPGDQQLINPGMSAKQAYSNWNSMMQYVKTNYETNLPAYNAITSQTGTNDQQGQPVAAPSAAPQAPQPSTPDWSSIMQ